MYVIYSQGLDEQVSALLPGSQRAQRENSERLRSQSLINEAEIKNWKTYTDSELGFEFKYPSEWGVKVSGGLITFQSVDSNGLLEVFTGSENTNNAFDNMVNSKCEIRNTQLSGINAEECSGRLNNGNYVSFIKPGNNPARITEINLWLKGDLADEFDYYSNILRTFKFIE